MIRLVPCALIVVFTTTSLFAQNRTKTFELTTPKAKVTSSLYNGISVMDLRLDTTSVGQIQKGLLNETTVLVAEKPLSTQFSEFMAAVTDHDAKEGKLLLQLRKLKVSEITEFSSEMGRFIFRASLFAKEGAHYKKLATIDTTVIVSSLDVTRLLLKKTNEVIADFIVPNLLKSSPLDNILYTEAELLSTDSIEKRSIPLYNTSSFPDGIYLNYNSFKNLEPDHPVTAKVKDDRLFAVKRLNDKGKAVSIPQSKIYAIIWEGKLFINTQFGYHPLQKQGDNFYFTGKVKDNANGAQVAAASVMFGAIGGAIAANSAISVYQLMLDHINGRHIKLKED